MNPPLKTAPTNGDSRHLSVLEALDGHQNISQRSLAERLGIAVSRVNRLIAELLELGYLEVVDESVRPYAYRLTSGGETYRRRLRHEDLQTVVGNFRAAQKRIRSRLTPLRDEGVSRVVFYGAGEIMEVTVPMARALGLEILGVVDDDPEKQGARRAGFEVRAPDRISEMDPDGIIITTFRHADQIYQRIGNDHVPDEARVIEL